jgi:type I restriction enzyme M protein
MADTVSTYLARALKDGYAKLSEDQEKISYLAVNHSEWYGDPEEKVRAEYWAELIYVYHYEPTRMGIEVVVPDRTPNDRADIVIFHDEDRKRPYAVIECKRDGISDTEFLQAIEQAWGNGTWAKFRAQYVGVVAGNTRRFFDCSDRWGVLEREQNIVADIPVQYSKPVEFKYYKGGKLDIHEVSREELIAAIQKSHQTLWGGGRMSPPAAFGELSKVLFVNHTNSKLKLMKRAVSLPDEFASFIVLSKKKNLMYSQTQSELMMQLCVHWYRI